MVGPIILLFPEKESPLDEPLYRSSYQLLEKLALERDIDLRFVIGKENYKKGVFQSYWRFEGDRLVQFFDSFKAKLVLLQIRNHGFIFNKRVNSEFLEELCTDKYKTSQQFEEFSKKTEILDENTRIDEFSTDLVVIKPRCGANGFKIHIIKKDEYDFNNFQDEKYIVQEFIDSSDGILDLTPTRHELRLFIFNGRIQSAYLRIPMEGSYLSNISQGAKAQQIDSSKIPQSAKDLKDKVDSAFSDISPRIYSMDIMFEGDRPWIVELNDMPGMPDVSVQPLTNNYLQEMLTLFEKEAAK